jgi:hypothetical protein
MGMVRFWPTVAEIAKPTGKKKPLSSLAAEATPPKGGMLVSILVRLWRVSNLIGPNQSYYLHTITKINPFCYILISCFIKSQYIAIVFHKPLIAYQLPSAIMAEG